MQITVNGELRECNEGITLGKLITDLDIRVKVMAVAINMDVVKKDEWDNRVLLTDDRVELLHFVGGG